MSNYHRSNFNTTSSTSSLRNHSGLMRTLPSGFPILGYVASFFIFLGVFGLAEILHTAPSSGFLDLFYDLVVLASVNAPFLAWGALFLGFIPRVILPILSLAFLSFAGVIFYIIITQGGFTVIASSSVIGLILLALTTGLTYFTQVSNENF